MNNNSNNTFQENKKKLENLYSWSMYYKTYNMIKDYEKIQIEIKEFKEKIGFVEKSNK